MSLAQPDIDRNWKGAERLLRFDDGRHNAVPRKYQAHYCDLDRLAGLSRRFLNAVAHAAHVSVANRVLGESVAEDFLNREWFDDWFVSHGCSYPIPIRGRAAARHSHNHDTKITWVKQLSNSTVALREFAASPRSRREQRDSTVLLSLSQDALAQTAYCLIPISRADHHDHSRSDEKKNPESDFYLHGSPHHLDCLTTCSVSQQRRMT